MNNNPPEQQQQQQPPRTSASSATCGRHPDEIFAGSFCPLCLCERLATLDSIPAPLSPAPPSANKNPASAAASAIKSIFKGEHHSKARPSSSSFFPELRRAKSFSASSKGESYFSGVFEPQRHSCDVRSRNLWTLFSQDDIDKKTSAASSSVGGGGGGQIVDEIQAAVEAMDSNNNNNNNIIRRRNVIISSGEIVHEEEEVPIIANNSQEMREGEAVKTIKDMMMDLSHKKQPTPPGGGGGRDLKEIAGSFWTAASIFSKKLQKWRRTKQKHRRNNNNNNGSGSATLPVEKPIGRQFRETQSEVADYGFGRRSSCDTDPRFSLDIGRISLDDYSRYSFDEPRASWDHGYLKQTIARHPPMVAVAEDPPPHPPARIIDAHIPLEESPPPTPPPPPPPPPPLPPLQVNHVDENNVPGGSAQTRDYYSDSSSRSRRKSFERSNSLRKTAASVVAEIEEMKAAAAAAVSHSKVSPTNVEYSNVPKLVVGDRELRDVNSTYLSHEYCSGPFDASFRDAAASSSTVAAGNGVSKGSIKKSRRWIKAFNIWGLIHWRNGNKDDDSRINGVERSYSESWQHLRAGKLNGEESTNRRIMRSNSSVSWRRSSYNMDAAFGSARKIGVEMNGNGHCKKKNEFTNQSSRFSPNHGNNNRSLFKFYLPPMRGSRRGGFGNAKPNNAHTFSRSGSRVY